MGTDRRDRLELTSLTAHDPLMKIETAHPSHFECLVAIWESSVRATHHFLQENDIVALRPLLLNTYLPNLKVVIAHDDAGVIHGFLGVDENRIEMLFIDAASRGKSVGKLLLQYAIAEFGVNEVDVNEQNPQGVEFYRHMGFEQIGRSELDGQGNPFPLLHMRLGGHTGINA